MYKTEISDDEILEQDAYMESDDPDADREKEARDALFIALDAFGESLSRTRSDDIAAREASGIEKEWLEDEEFYEGIDDANRSEMAAWRSKPLGTGAIDTSNSQSQATGSTVFPNITRPYCDAASARASDMLLPVDDKSWAIDSTPVAELIPIADGEFPPEIDAAINQQFPNPEAAQAEKARLQTEADKSIKKARASAEAASKRIEDWHVEGQYHANVRSVIEDASKAGTGILKGPFPAKKRHLAYIDGELIIKDEIKPVSICIDYWNFYPDGGCGSNIHNGSRTWERDDITPRSLKDLKGTPGYIDEQIDLCLAEGPYVACKRIERSDSPTGLRERETKSLFEIWYYHGSASKEEFDRITSMGNRADGEQEELQEGSREGVEGESMPEDGEQVFVQVTMVNNRVIRMIQNPLDTGEFPYDLMVWQKRKNMPWGMGVARQIRTAQRIVIAAVRNLMDNAGRAAGPQVIIDANYIQPQNNTYEITPWKFWLLTKSLEGQDDIDRVFRFITVDMLQDQLQAIVEYGLRLAEDATGLPMIMQGQTNSATPTTLGGMQLQNNNASTVLRRIARLFDDLVTEPHIRRYYRYLLQYGPDDAEKGEFVIDARGSSALVERETRNQQITQMAQMVSNPTFGLDPKKWAQELLKSMRLDVKRFEYDDEDWKKLVEQLSQAPQDPALQIAQLREEGAIQRTQIQEAGKQEIQASKENIEERKLMVAAQNDERQREFELLLNGFEQDVVAFLEQSDQGKVDKQLKAKIAGDAMKIRAMYDLASVKTSTPTPPAEPPGRAPDGEAYQK